MDPCLWQHRLNVARQQSVSRQAQALSMGEPDFIWLALETIVDHEYPQQACTAYAEARRLVRPFLESTEQESSALEQALPPSYTAETKARISRSVEQLRNGLPTEALQPNQPQASADEVVP